MRKFLFTLVLGGTVHAAGFTASEQRQWNYITKDFSPSQAMEAERASHATESNLLAFYYPGTPPDIQERYRRRSPNRHVDVQQVMWGTLMQWSYNHYVIPGYTFLGMTSWGMTVDRAKAMGPYAATAEYGLTANTARKIGADYAAYSFEYRNDPALGPVYHMQAAYYIKGRIH